MYEGAIQSKSIINLGTQPQPQQDDGLPTYQNVLEAVENLNGVTHVTPVVSSKTINEILGAKLNNGKGGKIEVFFKCENL